MTKKIRVKNRLGVSIVIPCYKSGDNIQNVISEIQNTFDDSFDLEIILISDDSPDTTWWNIVNLSLKFSNIRGFELGKNSGQHRATLFGITKATKELVITMDDDGQHDPNALLKVIEHFADSSSAPDLIYLCSSVRKESLLRLFFSSTVKFALKMFAGMKHARQISAFRVFRRSILPQNNSDLLTFDNIDILLDLRTQRICSLQVPFRKRTNGKSSYNFLKLFNHALGFLFKSSGGIISSMIIVGFLSSAITIGISLWIFSRWLFGLIEVQGFTTLSLLISCGFSIQFFILGCLSKFLFDTDKERFTAKELWQRNATD